MYYTYMLRCEDNSIYTGITTSLQKRMNEHFNKNKLCAKYTYRHTAKNVEAVWTSQNRATACKLEYEIKQLKKEEKEQIIKNKNKFKELLSSKLDYNNYKRMSKIKLEGELNGKYA